MKEELKDILWEAFLEKEYKNFLKGKRKYIHFDYPIKFDESLKDAPELFKSEFSKRFKKSYTTNEVLAIGFYPFIHYIQQTPRYKTGKDGKRRKKFKNRPIQYASHNDSLKLSWLCTQLDYGYEKILDQSEFSESILAYRKFDNKQSNIDFALKAFQDITNFKNPVAVCFDVKKFFDNISHDELKNNWLLTCQELYDEELNQLPKHHYHAFKVMTQFQFVEKNVLEEMFSHKKLDGKRLKRYTTNEEFRDFVRGSKSLNTNPLLHLKKGIPQGTPVSAVLANISMLNFDKAIHEIVNELGGKYYRYSDDILLITEAQHLNVIKELVPKTLEPYGLIVSHGKTEIIKFERSGDSLIAKDEYGSKKNLQYLGFEFDGEHVLVRSSTLSRYHGKMRRGIENAINHAKGKRSKTQKVYKSKLFARYASLKYSNFVSYAHRAALDQSELDTSKIDNQIASRYKLLNKELKKRSSRKRKKTAPNN